MHKILVAGGAGFIGSHLVDKLIDLGDEVVVIDNLYSGKKEYINPQAKFYEVDIRSKEISDIFAAEKFDYVFQLAAQIEVPRSVKEPEFDNHVNAMGSLNVFKNSAETGVKKVIFMSTGGALYGDCTSPATEETLIRPTSPYAIHKYAAERYLRVLNEEEGLEYAVLRPANVYGPRQYKGGECGVIGVFTSNALKDEASILYGDGSKTRDYVFVDDLINACLAVIKEKVKGVYNIGREIEISNFEIIKAIEKVTGKKFNFSFAPDKAGEVKRSVLNYTKVKNDIGWEPTVDLETGIRRTLDWLKQQNN